MSSIGEVAVDYTRRSLAVLPLYGIKDGRCTCGKTCDSPGKHPHRVLVPNGLKDASSDPEQVGRWYRAYPEGEINVGIVLRNLVAIDEDEPGAVLAAGIELPNCPSSRTGRGHHYLFKLNGHALHNGRFAPGLDCKTGEAYIVAPPSVHLSGHLYAWTPGHGLGDLEPPELPGSVERLIIAAHGGKPGTGKDDLHDIFGGLKLEAVFLEIERLTPSSGDRWRQLMLRVIRSLIGRGWRDDAILTMCRRATRRDLGFTHEQTDAFVADEIRRTRHKDKTPEPDEETFAQIDGEAADDARNRLRLVAPSEMDWRGAELNLIKGILGCAMMALLYGESGSAKTLIALSMALHVALGREWCGRKVKQGFVAYLAPEGGHSVHLRFHAWCRHHGVNPKDDRLPFRTIPVRVDLCKSDADLTGIVANIKAAEAELGPCILVVVDTVSRALGGGNENAPDDMGKFVLNCDQLREEIGATVLGVHHTPKGGDDPRGHSSLKNGSEVRLMARKVASGLFSLALDHLKDGEAGGEMFFNLHSAVVGKNDDGDEVSGGLVTRATITAAGAAGRPQHLTDRQLRILQELRKEVTATKRWQFTAEEFNDRCIRSGAVDGDRADKRQRCHDLKTQLANKGYISVDGNTIRLVMQGA